MATINEVLTSVIILSVIIVVLLILVLAGVIINPIEAKREAKKMLDADRIENLKMFNRIYSVLKTTENDLESADLCEKLQELKGREGG